MNKITKKIIGTIIAILIPAVSSAQIVVRNPLAFDNFPDILDSVLRNILVPIATVLVTIMIVFYGMKLVTSQGKPEEVAKAKQMLKWGLIGAFVILGASAITGVIVNTTAGLSSGS